MKKILTKIEKELKGLTKEEKINILTYYEEIINDRLETGESLENIDNSIDYLEIRKTYFPKTINERENINVKETLKTSLKLLLYLLASPIMIPLAILYLVFIFLIYVFVIVGAIIGLAVIATTFGMVIKLLIESGSFGNIMIMLGAFLLIIPLVSYPVYYVVMGGKKLNDFLIKVVTSKLIKRGQANG